MVTAYLYEVNTSFVLIQVCGYEAQRYLNKLPSNEECLMIRNKFIRHSLPLNNVNRNILFYQ